MQRDLYSREAETRTADGGRIDTLPTFRLAYSFDDQRRPTEVTVFDGSSSAGILTSWLTVDIGHAVPLEEVR